MNSDKAIQECYEALDRVRWRECENEGAPDDTFEWYYAEDRLYVIRHKKMKMYYFVKASSPLDAFGKMRARYLG